MINGNGTERFQGIRKIKGTLYAGRIHFQTAETDEITVESAGIHDKLGFQAYEKDGGLYLRTDRFVLLRKNMGSGIITVTLPEGQALEEIDLLLKAGELTADRLSAEKLTVETGAGRVSIQDFSAAEARLVCTAGSLSGKGDATEQIEVACSVGEVNLTLKGSKQDYDYELECGIGEVNCGHDRYSGIGRVVHLDHQAAKRIKVSCGIGQIKLDYAPES